MATHARVTTIKINGTSVSDPVSVSIIRDNELIEKLSSNSRKAQYYQGKTVKGVQFVCRDVAIFKAFKKGTRVTSFEGKIESAIETDGTTEDGSTETVVTIEDSAIVTEAVSFETSTDGGPAEYSITVMLCRSASGTPGKLLIDEVEV